MNGIAQIIEKEFFTTQKVVDNGFYPMPPEGKCFMISLSDLTTFT